MGLERPLRKQSGGLFLGRGRVPLNDGRIRQDVDIVQYPLPFYMGKEKFQYAEIFDILEFGCLRLRSIQSGHLVPNHLNHSI